MLSQLLVCKAILASRSLVVRQAKSALLYPCSIRYQPHFGSCPPYLANSIRRLSTIISSDNIVHSPYPDISPVATDISLTTFLFEQILKKNPNQTAIVDGITGRSMSFTQVHEEAMKFGSGLTRRGVSAGSVVLLLISNSIEFATAFLGAIAAGCIVSTANILYTARELEYQIKDSNATLVVTSVPFLDVAVQAARESGVGEVIVAGASSEDDQGGVHVVPFDHLLMDSGSALSSIPINNRQEVAVIPYSSGTTGKPKGVQLSHFNLISNIQQLSANSDVVCMTRFENESILGLMPFFHIYGMVVLLLNSLFQQAKLIALPKFEPDTFLAAIEQHRISQLFLAPPLVIFLCKHPSVSRYDLSSVYNICSAAAPLGSSVAKEAVERLPGSSIMQGYGLTELSPVCHWSPFSSPRDGSIGVPVPSTEVAIFSDAKKVGPRESGEICVRGPQVMLGYLNRPEATAEMIDKNGWLHTGDIGHFDNDGYFFVTDRLKELIKRKGYQVAPAELEQQLLLHPNIIDAAVAGVPDEREGELPAAFIVRREHSNLTAEEVLEFMSGKVAPFKRLDGGITFVDSIPKTPSGKIIRRQLRIKV